MKLLQGLLWLAALSVMLQSMYREATVGLTVACALSVMLQSTYRGATAGPSVACCAVGNAPVYVLWGYCRA